MSWIRRKVFVSVVLFAALSALGFVSQSRKSFYSLNGVQSIKLAKNVESPTCDSIDDKKIMITGKFFPITSIFLPSYAHPHVSEGNTIFVWWFLVTGDFGNDLSRYYSWRILAELGGYNLELATPIWSIHDSFLVYLPTRAQAKKPKQRVLQKFLCVCPQDISFVHECDYGVPDIIPTIRREVRIALQQYADAKFKTKRLNNLHGWGNERRLFWNIFSGDSRQESKRQLLGQFYDKDDWLIYDRCQILDHVLHGFGTLSVYDVIPSNGSFTIYSLSGRKEGLGVLCDELQEIRNDYIRSRNPNVTIFELQESNRNVDFGRLANAPNLLIPSAGSTWALYAALANVGRVVMLPFQTDNHRLSSKLPPNIKVLQNATVIYNPKYHKEYAKLLGFSDPQYATTPKGKELLFDCYRNC
ncbi:expressed unknown protein [Seminavis robusta]|uniref:Uncharacterized protein n=1 Tax=Seminavis robusta TaxID=568900 RepID=A0A9N8EKU6_9STRA|nr:expressed unknown protein [Seminavis robusta]|eukprot:Sro1437_g272570.1 n/a (414) ;mRNA; f:19278-20519